ncbi:hypothetical protein O181_021741 [Austropuccinia psidii MF-1]|uniref:Uncharacterized protein n=1 Tax=Austropuccinia psidii MF-1 TaxID=1389203 RepID=A0A9Q3CBJ6_9BASI|nr:hypothetical protein [Austropuccinia psidii MF-1]
MNFVYHSSAQPFSLASSLGPELNDLLNSQADQIQQLQQRLEARDQEFEILLSQVNDLHVQNQNQLLLSCIMEEFNQYFNTNNYKVPRANRRNQPATTSACILDYYSFSFETIKREHRQAVDYMYDLGTSSECLEILHHRPRDEPWLQTRFVGAMTRLVHYIFVMNSQFDDARDRVRQR